MRDIRNEFVTYEIALRMKQLEFDEPCFGWYEHNSNFYYCYQEGLVPPSPSKKLIKGAVKAPTFQQAFRWFRDKYPEINPTYNLLFILDKTSQTENPMTYEEAELACLEKLLSIVEQKEKEI